MLTTGENRTFGFDNLLLFRLTRAYHTHTGIMYIFCCRWNLSVFELMIFRNLTNTRDSSSAVSCPRRVVVFGRR